MVRRVFLKLTVAAGTLAFLFLDLISSVREVFAYQAQKKAQIKERVSLPTSVEQAIDSHDPDKVVAFVLRHPLMATGARLGDKIKMLQIMKTNMTTAKEYAVTALAGGPANYENAILILVKDLENDPEALSKFVEAMGGKSWVSAKVRTAMNPKLKSFAAKALEK